MKVMASGPLRLKIDFPLTKLKRGGEFTEIMVGCDGDSFGRLRQREASQREAFQRNRSCELLRWDTKGLIDAGSDGAARPKNRALQPMVYPMSAKVALMEEAIAQPAKGIAP
jgi:hypothetical protein